jgi:hypothetical protein
MTMNCRPAARPLALAALLLASTALTAPARAQDATWLLNPANINLDDGANWSGGTVPTGTATFGATNSPNLQNFGSLTMGGWSFTAGHPDYSIMNWGSLSFTGAGLAQVGGFVILLSDGTIDFSNSSSAGNLSLLYNRSGTLNFRDSSSAGSGALRNENILRFNDTTTAGTARIVTVPGGSTSFLDNSTAASATLYNAGLLGFYNSSTAATATIENDYVGTVSFGNSSTAASATIKNNGSLGFYDSSTAASAVITNIGMLTFYNSSTAATATITNNGGVYFRNTTTAASAVFTNNGSISFNDSSTAATATITNTYGSGLVFNNASTAASAAITNAHGGGIFFYDLATAANATIANEGGISFNGVSTAANAIINNTGYGGLSFRHTSTAGNATITNTLWNVIAFHESSTAGAATITNDRGGIYFTGASSTGTATIVSSGWINMTTTDTTGAATMTISGTGLPPYSPPAELYGFGAVGNTTVEAGGKITPHDGTLIVNGNLTMMAGSAYGFVAGGLASITGTATLGGASLSFRAPDWQSHTYKVLTATGGVSGTFSLDSFYGGFATVLYGPNDVTLTVGPYRASTALMGLGGVNARSVAAGIDRHLASLGGSAPAALYANFLLAYYGPALASKLQQMSGEAATGAQANAFGGASTFLNIMLDPMAGARGATASAPGSSLIEMADTAAARTPAARVEAGWSVWTKAYGQAGRTAADAGTGTGGTSSGLYGVAAGADRLISADTLVGFALAGGGSNFGLTTGGSGTGDFFQAGLYGSTRLWDGYVSAAAAYGWNRFDVTRRAGGLVVETYRSSPVAHTLGGRVETGRRFGTRSFGWTPYAAAEAIGYFAPAYTEGWQAPHTGAFALAYAARTTGTVRTELGLRLDGMRAVAPTADLVTFGRLAYAYQPFTQRTMEAQFQALANSGFTVFGARASTHTVLASVGTEVRLAAGTRATASLDGELGERHRSVRANLGLRQSW